MKKLLAALAALAIVTVQADTPYTVTTQFNVRITVSPNGALDAPPVWTSTGPGVLTVDANGLGGVVATTTPGTNTITISATALGNPIVTHVILTINAPAPPPATTLAVGVAAIPK